jgi:hypothetical protein
MNVREIDLVNVLPMQRIGVSSEHLTYLQGLLDTGVRLGPVVVTSIDLEETSGFMLLNGTHRAYLTHMRGEPHIEAELLETNADLEAADPDLSFRYGTLDVIREKYRDIWRVRALVAGIRSIGDLPVHACSRTDLFAPYQF